MGKERQGIHEPVITIIKSMDASAIGEEAVRIGKGAGVIGNGEEGSERLRERSNRERSRRDLEGG